MNEYDIIWAIVLGLYLYDIYKETKEISRISARLLVIVVVIVLMILSYFS